MNFFFINKENVSKNLKNCIFFFALSLKILNEIFSNKFSTETNFHEILN